VAEANVNPYAPPTADLETHATTDSSDVPASRSERLGASILDTLITVPFLILVGGLFFFIFRDSLRGPDDMSRRFAVQAILLIGIAPLWIYQWRLIARTGQTLGKKWVGIKIVRLDGSPVDFASGVVLRSWVLSGATVLLSALGAQMLGNVIGMIDSIMIFGAERRTLHDHIAGTRVISIKRPL
jgi:uncharacterized RDD family membrane protein YckC